MPSTPGCKQKQRVSEPYSHQFSRMRRYMPLWHGELENNSFRRRKPQPYRISSMQIGF